MLASLVC